METPQYHQDVQNDGVALMDTTSILQQPDGMSPDFISNLSPTSHLVQTQIMQGSSSVFSTIADQAGIISPMHIPMSDISSPAAFMSPMDVVSVPHLRSGPPGFISDLPTLDSFTMVPPMDNAMNLEISLNAHPLSTSSSQSQIPSPSIHGTASSYSSGVTSSLESALDQPGSAPRSRANTFASSSIGAASFLDPAPSEAGMPFLPTEAIMSKQEDVTCEAEAESVVAVGNMLEDIEHTAKQARAMLQHRHDMATGSNISHLNERISQVTQRFAGLVSISSALASTTYSAPLHSPGILALEQKENPLNFPPVTTSPTSSMDLSEFLSIPDQSRKRCASELEEHRSVKAPKMEPQDDVPLSTPFVDTPLTTEISSQFPVTRITLPVVPIQPHSTSTQPSSRATTPPSSFSPHGPFSMAESNYAFSAAISQSVDFNPKVPPPLNNISSHFPGIHSSWSDPVLPTRHHHSLSAGAINGPHLPSSNPAVSGGMPEQFPTPPSHQIPLQPLPSAAPNAISPPIGRMSRSGSINGSFPNSYGFGYIEPFPEPAGSWPNGLGRLSGKLSAHTPPTWLSGTDSSVSSLSPSSTSDRPILSTVPSTTVNSPVDDDEDDDDVADSDEDSNHSKGAHHLSDGPVGPTVGNDIPLEYRTEVDRIFFEYLTKICSNLDATDSKGELIHQTLMAKKMQRLDESPDFRPFKFRIQAFTSAYLDELALQGYPEDKLPMKKVRNYLWRHPYIQRFNEDGKKAKSKGNHIWNIEAKKIGDGKWEFRPFHRKLAGAPPSVAYCGLKWSWSPRIWDPQASWLSVPVEYSSPSLPAWLSWDDDVLSGTPPPDAESCRIVANAKFTLDGQEGTISHSFFLTIAPVNTLDTTSYVRSRRPSFASDSPRRSSSDSMLFQAVQRAKPRPPPARVSPESPDTRVIRVLQSVAQRVTEEAQSQFVLASPPKSSELQDLVKQKHVLEQTVDAYDKAISGNNPIKSRRLAVAAQNVVVQAAHTVIADRTAACGGVPIQQSETAAIKSVTVTELTDATQDAIAQAIKREGTASTEVDIMVAATSILKLRTAGSPPAESPQTAIPQPRSHSTATTSRSITNKASSYLLSSVSEYV